MLRGLDALRRFLLERVHHPDIGPELHRIHDLLLVLSFARCNLFALNTRNLNAGYVSPGCGVTPSSHALLSIPLLVSHHLNRGVSPSVPEKASSRDVLRWPFAGKLLGSFILYFGCTPCGVLTHALRGSDASHAPPSVAARTGASTAPVRAASSVRRNNVTLPRRSSRITSC